MTYRKLLQTSQVNDFIESTPNNYNVHKPRIGTSKATYNTSNVAFNTKIEIATKDTRSELEKLKLQLRDKSLPPAQKKRIKEEISNLKNMTLDYCIQKLAHTRIIDVFNLLQIEMEKNIKERRMTPEEAKTKTWCFELSIEYVKKMLNVSFANANLYLEGLADLLKVITITSYTTKGKYPDFIDTNITIQRKKQKGVFYFYFHPSFIALMSWGSSRPILLNFDYDARNLIYMGKLRNYLEGVFYNSELNSGQIKRIKIENLLKIFYKANIVKNPKKSFIEPLKKHLAELGKTGEFIFYFSGEKGKQLSESYRIYLDLDKEGRLLSETEGAEIEEIGNTRARVKINELLQNVYLNFTFVDRPVFHITQSTAQKRRRSREKKQKTKEKTAKTRTE